MFLGACGARRRSRRARLCPLSALPSQPLENQILYCRHEPFPVHSPCSVVMAHRCAERAVRSEHGRRPGLQVWDTGAARAFRRGPRRGILQWRASPELFASITMLASVTGLSAAPRACQAAFAPGGATMLGGHFCPARSRACSCVGADRWATQRRGRSRALGDDGAVRLPLAGNMRMMRRAALSASSGRRNDEGTRAELERRRLQGGLPQHLAIVMDGNRRYAKSLGFPTASVPAPHRPAHPHPVAQLAFIRAVLPVSMAA